MTQTPAQALGVAKRRISHRARKWAAIKAEGVTADTIEEALAKALSDGRNLTTILHDFDYTEAEQRRSLRSFGRDYRHTSNSRQGRPWRGKRVAYSVERILKAVAWLKRAKETRALLVRKFGEWEPLFAAYESAGVRRASEIDHIYGRLCGDAGHSRYSSEGNALRHTAAYQIAVAKRDAEALARYRNPPPELPEGAGEWTERRKGDRKRMADAIEALARHYGCEIERYDDGGRAHSPRETCVRFTLRGVGAFASFDGDSRCGGVVLPWHARGSETPRFSERFGVAAGGTVNQFHRHKCTAVHGSFARAYRSIDAVLALIVSGDAFEAYQPQPLAA